MYARAGSLPKRSGGAATTGQAACGAGHAPLAAPPHPPPFGRGPSAFNSDRRPRPTLLEINPDVTCNNFCFKEFSAGSMRIGEQIMKELQVHNR
jgi:hypothetical protein